MLISTSVISLDLSLLIIYSPHSMLHILAFYCVPNILNIKFLRVWIYLTLQSTEISSVMQLIYGWINLILLRHDFRLCQSIQSISHSQTRLPQLLKYGFSVITMERLVFSVKSLHWFQSQCLPEQGNIQNLCSAPGAAFFQVSLSLAWTSPS